MNRATNRGSTLGWAVGLLLAVLPALSSGSEKQSDPTLRALVEDYVHAIEANHLELAMPYVHAASPHRARLEAELEDQLSWYFERAQTHWPRTGRCSAGLSRFFLGRG